MMVEVYLYMLLGLFRRKDINLIWQIALNEKGWNLRICWCYKVSMLFCILCNNNFLSTFLLPCTFLNLYSFRSLNKNNKIWIPLEKKILLCELKNKHMNSLPSDTYCDFFVIAKWFNHRKRSGWNVEGIRKMITNVGLNIQRKELGLHSFLHPIS